MDAPRILVVFDSPLPAPTGRATRALSLLRGLTSLSSVDVMALGGEGEAHVDMLAGARLFRVPGRGPDAPALLARAARRQMQGDSYALVQTDHPAVLCALAGAGAALVLDALSFPSIEGRYQGTAPGELDRLRDAEGEALRAAAAVLVPCAVTREHAVASGAAATRVHVIPPPVSLEDFAPAPLSPTPPLRLLYPGGREAWQGLPSLLLAMRLVALRAPVRLTIVGPAPDPDDLHPQVRELGLADVVEILAPVPNQRMPALYAACHAVVAPLLRTERNRRQGAAPMKIAEAFAAGRPVIAPALPMVTAMMQDGVQGILYEPGSEPDLARAIAALALDPGRLEALGAAARAQAVARFSSDDATRALTLVYRGVLQAGGHAPLRPHAPVDPDRGTEPGLQILPRRP